MKTLTREEVVKLSLLLHKADEEGMLIFNRSADEDGYVECALAFMNNNEGYMVVLGSVPGNTSFGIGTLDNVYVSHTMGVHEFCPELAALCDWIKRRAESVKNSTASTKELAKLIKGWGK